MLTPPFVFQVLLVKDSLPLDIEPFCQALTEGFDGLPGLKIKTLGILLTKRYCFPTTSTENTR
ncbi:hypothetical protein E2C01_043949 [Portunus trituberculatus]|uniref:Uncharacterized protein n=1 Tax=Portunus trituberculatus TaxID=210409 RepID=A0A5B7FXI1_PORTR|nr:hypothetical protein [Portunus trituberculatus]